MVRCILAAPARCRSVEDCVPAVVHRSRSGSLAGPSRRSGSALQSLDPAVPSRFVARGRQWKTVWSESRTDPLEPRFSPDFRAAVSLGLLTFAPNPLDGKRPNFTVCAKA
ncbi:MAG: hypothetical protein EBR82_09030 [Caulobacteraceae bacterium]|nr:hypothetical protein [Caulobacteraceae bacterium]